MQSLQNATRGVVFMWAADTNTENTPEEEHFWSCVWLRARAWLCVRVWLCACTLSECLCMVGRWGVTPSAPLG